MAKGNNGKKTSSVNTTSDIPRNRGVITKQPTLDVVQTDEAASTTSMYDSKPIQERHPSKIAFYIVVSVILSLFGSYAWLRINDPRRYVRIGTTWTWIPILLFVGLVFYVLHKVRTVDPGIVDRERWDAPLDVSWYHPIEKKKNLTRRFCRKTQLWKPDRAHLCRSTNRLIKRYDHHCIFVDASVGHGNHKYFMLFLIYTCLAGLSISAELILHGRILARLPPGVFQILYLLVFVFSIASAIAVFLFYLFHVYLIWSGYTTLENFEKKGKYVQGVKYVTPFTSTFYNNFKQISGPNIIHWLLPTSPNNGDGIYFN